MFDSCCGVITSSLVITRDCYRAVSVQSTLPDEERKPQKLRENTAQKQHDGNGSENGKNAIS